MSCFLITGFRKILALKRFKIFLKTMRLLFHLNSMIFLPTQVFGNWIKQSPREKDSANKKKLTQQLALHCSSSSKSVVATKRFQSRISKIFNCDLYLSRFAASAIWFHITVLDCMYILYNIDNQVLQFLSWGKYDDYDFAGLLYHSVFEKL